MRFPSRDLTDQYISSSYQDVLQQYMPSDYLYVLDGYGNVVFGIPSASFGNTLVTSDITSSMTVATASYALSSGVVELFGYFDGGTPEYFFGDLNPIVGGLP